MNRRKNIIICCLFPLFFCKGDVSFVREKAPTPEQEKPNVVLIVIDSLRRDHLGCCGYFRPTSPTIDSLSEEGVFFSDVISQSSQTAPSVASLITGLYPKNHGVQFYSFNQAFDPEDRTIPPHLRFGCKTLAEYLRVQGYTTLAVVSNPWVRSEFGYGQGFETYLQVGSWDGRSINTAFLKHMDKDLKKRPFFVYLHYMDVHAPYYNPESFQGIFTAFKGDHVYGMGYKDVVSDEDLAYSVALYDEEIFYTDSLIKQVLEKMKENKILENTLVIITSDHGEEFLEHQGMGHGTNLYAEQINTFFVLYSSSLLGPAKIEQRVETVDFFPTVLDILDVAYDPKKIDGISLFPLINQGGKAGKKYMFSELGDKKVVLENGWKYIYNPFLKTEELYDTNKDQKEVFNRVDSQSPRRKRLRDLLLNDWIEGSKSPSSSLRISDELREKLHSLSYLAGKDHVKIYTHLKKSITDRLDFMENDFNPLQLVYGWKEDVETEEEGFCWIGPMTKFVLSEPSGRKQRLCVEGRLDLENFSDGSQRVSLYCENEKLGQAVLDKEGLFILEFNIPRGLGKNRPLEFTLMSDNWFTRHEDEGGLKFPKLSLLLSAVYYRERIP